MSFVEIYVWFWIVFFHIWHIIWIEEPIIFLPTSPCYILQLSQILSIYDNKILCIHNTLIERGFLWPLPCLLLLHQHEMSIIWLVNSQHTPLRENNGCRNKDKELVKCYYDEKFSFQWRNLKKISGMLKLKWCLNVSYCPISMIWSCSSKVLLEFLEGNFTEEKKIGFKMKYWRQRN